MFDHLDGQDKAICEAVVAGKTNEEIVAELGVAEDKVVALRTYASTAEDKVAEPTEEVKVDEPADVDESEEVEEAPVEVTPASSDEANNIPVDIVDEEETE